QDFSSVPLEGSAPAVRIVFGVDGVGKTDITPDGTSVVFDGAKSGTQHGLFSAPINGSQPPIEIGPALPGFFNVPVVAFAPDGLRVVGLASGSSGSLFTAWIDGSHPAVPLDQFQFATGEMGFTTNDELVYRARPIGGYATILFRVPLLGGQAPLPVLDPFPSGQEATGFLIDPTGTQILYRADREADERYELYLLSLYP